MARVILAGEAGDEMRLAARREAQLRAGASTHVSGYLDVFARARTARGYAKPMGRGPMPDRVWPSSPQFRPTQMQVFGGPLADAAIRVRTMMK